MYGLPMVHKDGVPVRPIISAIGTYSYRLAKYLDEILKPLASGNNRMLHDTFDFVNKVSQLDIARDSYLVSFDVESLFTNIPTQETIEIILKRAFKRETDLYFGLRRGDLKKLLEICTQESHFQFAGQYYDQIDGVAMGSPLGPLFANVFMSEFENTHLDKLDALGLVSWYRYVDDVFASVKDENCVNMILSYLNQQHPNIRYTVEY